MIETIVTALLPIPVTLMRGSSPVGGVSSNRIRLQCLSGHEVGEMDSPLVMALVVEAFDGRILDGAVHPFDLTVRPGVVGFRAAMRDVVCFADHVEAHLARPGGVPVARLLGELDSIVRQDRVDALRHGFQQVSEELPRPSSMRPVDESIFG